MDYRKLALDNTILRVLTGSQAYGTSVDTGQPSDRDEKGVCIESRDVFVGFNGFEQYEYRTAVEREGHHQAKSQPGDLDLVIYSLHKFLRLALKGNPQIVEMFFLKPIEVTELGKSLQGLAPFIVSRSAGKAYLGYMKAQLERLKGERGGKDVNRPELVEKFGFDTKYAMHVVRLGMQGVELLKTGKLTLPLQEDDRNVCLAVRGGKLKLEEVLKLASELETELKSLLDNSPLPELPDQAFVEAWMIKTYWNHWQGQAALEGMLGNYTVN